VAADAGFESGERLADAGFEAGERLADACSTTPATAGAGHSNLCSFKNRRYVATSRTSALIESVGSVIEKSLPR